MQDRHQEAISYLERSCELAIWNTDYYIALVNAYQQAGKLDRAIAVCRGAMKFDNFDNEIAKRYEELELEKEKLLTKTKSKTN